MWLHHSSKRCIKTIAIEVLKSFNNLNHTFMNQIFQAKTISYDLRNFNVLFQPSGKKSHMVILIKVMGMSKVPMHYA